MALITLCALFVLFSALCHLGEAIVAIPGDSVTFSMTESCKDGEFKTNNSEVTVAKFVNGVWKPEGLYKDRITHNSPSSVVLTSVRYNDNFLYEFYCAGSVVTRIQLEVVVPDDESVTDGEQVRLKCYSQTARRPVKLLKWEKDGKRVFEVERASEFISNRTGFGERNVSVSQDWYLTGDLSLTMEKVRTEDRGVYMCSTVEEGGETRRGNPAAVRMGVTERIPEQNTAPTECPTQEPPGEKAMSAGTIVAIAEAVIIVVMAGLGVLHWFRSHRSNVSSGPGAENSNVELHPMNGSAPPGSPVNGGPSRFNNN